MHEAADLDGCDEITHLLANSETTWLVRWNMNSGATVVLKTRKYIWVLSESTLPPLEMWNKCRFEVIQSHLPRASPICPTQSAHIFADGLKWRKSHPIHVTKSHQPQFSVEGRIYPSHKNCVESGIRHLDPIFLLLFQSSRPKSGCCYLVQTRTSMDMSTLPHISCCVRLRLGFSASEHCSIHSLSRGVGAFISYHTPLDCAFIFRFSSVMFVCLLRELPWVATVVLFKLSENQQSASLEATLVWNQPTHWPTPTHRPTLRRGWSLKQLA